MSEFSASDSSDRQEPWPEREDYHFPSRHSEYIREIIEDSAGTSKQRRDYIFGVLAKMYPGSGVMRYVESYAQAFSSIYLTEPAGPTDAASTYQASTERYEVFGMGSLLAVHGVISPIRSQAMRLNLRLRHDYDDVTDFGQLDDDMRRQQATLYYEQNIDQLIDDLPPDLIEVLEEAIDILYDDRPVKWQTGIVDDFLHGFYVAYDAIQQQNQAQMATTEEIGYSAMQPDPRKVYGPS